jgi:hypothetical protein
VAPEPVRHQDSRRQPEPPGVASRTVLLIAVGFLAFVGLSLGALQLYYRHGVAGPVLAPPPRVFPEPRLQADPKADLAELKRQQEQRLAGYAWIDRDAGLVQIPIERAMALIAARGEAAFAPLETPP